ncbi:MAG: hypothetical protein A2166_03710 [Omnitrophica WOR_2 bacterium RBG_13_41_10]|nr:MAG: hypothetical protein A2166_03710 [Omnitrophica WOR_2 bacterium RBG_13_41_10]
MRHRRYKDWAVTTCFYTAVHIAEAVFFTLRPRNFEHSETTIPPKQRNRPSYSFHSWRKELIKELIARSRLQPKFLYTFQSLHDQSNISRYLMIPSGRNTIPPNSLNQLARDYFSDRDISDFLNKDLKFIEQEAINCGVKISFVKQHKLINFIKSFFKR